MKNDWILDVLADLKAFAQSNDLPALSEQLTKSADMAAIEIASAQIKVRRTHGDDFKAGTDLGGLGESRRA